MFILISSLLIIMSLLIYQVNSKLNIVEYFTTIGLLLLILAYLFYLDKVKKDDKEHYETKMIFESSVEESNVKNKVEEEVEKDENNSDHDFDVICEEEMNENCKNYIPLKYWEKLSDIPERLKTDFLPNFKEFTKNASMITSSNANDTNDTEDPETSMMVDVYYVQQKNKAFIYIKLGVIYDKDKISDENIDNVNMIKLNEISEKIDKLNTVLFSFKLYSPDIYKKLLKTFQ
jgi:Ca2+/Na+ antiporter